MLTTEMVISIATAAMVKEIRIVELPYGSWADGSAAEHVGSTYKATVGLKKAEDELSNTDSPRIGIR
eukprot:7375979-Prymnesium_polylepis.1